MARAYVYSDLPHDDDTKRRVPQQPPWMCSGCGWQWGAGRALPSTATRHRAEAIPVHMPASNLKFERLKPRRDLRRPLKIQRQLGCWVSDVVCVRWGRRPPRQLESRRGQIQHWTMQPLACAKFHSCSAKILASNAAFVSR